MRLEATSSGLRRAGFVESQPARPGEGVLAEATSQIEAYFVGRLREFELPLDLQGTPHDLAHWRRLLRIPYGGLATYGEIARELGTPGGARAVGQANARNPVAIVVPCHRVVLATGADGGYAGGAWRKRALLELEAGQARLAV